MTPLYHAGNVCSLMVMAYLVIQLAKFLCTSGYLYLCDYSLIVQRAGSIWPLIRGRQEPPQRSNTNIPLAPLPPPTAVTTTTPARPADISQPSPSLSLPTPASAPVNNPWTNEPPPYLSSDADALLARAGPFVSQPGTSGLNKTDLSRMF